MLAWKNLDFSQLKDPVHAYTKQVMLQLKAQGTLPAMAQAVNEINHGMVWPEGRINHPDRMAQLLIAGTNSITRGDQMK